jgi:hypothetical protein
MSGTYIMGAISFWLTVTLAAAGSLLSAVCIHDPVSEPKRDPYFFIGQWFTWLATPLLWGTVAASLIVEWLKPFDLLLVLLLAVASRSAAQAVCNLKGRPPATFRVWSTLSDRSGIRELRNFISCSYGLHKHHKLD